MATAPPTRITTSLLDVPTLSALPLKPSLPVIAYATMLRKDGTAMTAKDRAIVEGQDILSVATSITVTKGKSVRSLKTAVDEESRPTKKLKTAMIPTKRVRTDDSFPQSLLDIYDQVHKTKPWTRYLRAGSILPDCDGLNAFNDTVRKFWRLYGQKLWERSYSPYSTNQLDSLIRQVMYLYTELQLLMDNTDYSNSLVHFMCFPHPAWPILTLKPPTPRAILAGDPKRNHIVADYWLKQSICLWPDVPSVPHPSEPGSVVYTHDLMATVA
ncbi:hypothetical protein DYB30_007678 [Aphanomyces astaci]|uniref:Uncharacterized protein n=1 Tax=Aphanomyces astaci TaxID=112090 RepID=A0A397DMJ7_APHAT|nr:hypothetical protein DYB30_007678 [Aphanomyces astaci]